MLVLDCMKKLDTAVFEAIQLLKKKTGIKRSKEARLERILDQTPDLKKLIEENQKILKEENADGPQPIRVVLVLNKVDLCNNKRRLLALRDELEDLFHFEKIFIVSSETGFGVAELVDYLRENAPNSPWKYTKDAISENSEVTIATEIGKEALFLNNYKEIPYTTKIELKEFVLRSDGVFKMEYKLSVGSRNQRNILLGKKGRQMHKMRKYVETELGKRLGLRAEVNFKVVKKKKLTVFGEEAEVLATEEEVLKEEIEEIEKIKTGARIGVKRGRSGKGKKREKERNTVDKRSREEELVVYLEELKEEIYQKEKNN